MAAFLTVADRDAGRRAGHQMGRDLRDALTLDPHAQNEGPTHGLTHQIYEPLILRDQQGKAIPALAESWGITADPLVWEFRLRKGVTFHDGTPFTADDVIYSFERARQPSAPT